MDEVNKSRIQEIEERVKAATPGEWKLGEENGTKNIVSSPEHYIAYCSDVVGYEYEATEIRGSDAALIAHAPADLRFLIAEVERLQKYEHAYIELTRELASPLASVEFLRRTNARLHGEGVSPDGASWGAEIAPADRFYVFRKDDYEPGGIEWWNAFESIEDAKREIEGGLKYDDMEVYRARGHVLTLVLEYDHTWNFNFSQIEYFWKDVEQAQLNASERGGAE